jgi:hypothetical protein
VADGGPLLHDGVAGWSAGAGLGGGVAAGLGGLEDQGQLVVQDGGLGRVLAEAADVEQAQPRPVSGPGGQAATTGGGVAVLPVTVRDVAAGADAERPVVHPLPRSADPGLTSESGWILIRSAGSSSMKFPNAHPPKTCRPLAATTSRATPAAKAGSAE